MNLRCEGRLDIAASSTAAVTTSHQPLRLEGAQQFTAYFAEGCNVARGISNLLLAKDRCAEEDQQGLAYPQIASTSAGPEIRKTPATGGR